MKNRALKEAIAIGTLGCTSVITIDENTFAIGCGSGELAIYKHINNKWILNWSQKLENLVSGLSYNPNGKLIAVTNLSQAVVIDINEKKTYLLQEGHNGAISHLRFANGKCNMFATASQDGSIRFWDMKTF